MDRGAGGAKGKPVRRLLDEELEILVREAAVEVASALAGWSPLFQTEPARKLLATALEEPVRHTVARALDIARRYNLRPRRGPRPRKQARSAASRWVRVRFPADLVEGARLAARWRRQGFSELMADAMTMLLYGEVPLEPPMGEAWWQAYRKAEAQRPDGPVRLVDIYRALQEIYPIAPATFRALAARFCLPSWPTLRAAEEKTPDELTPEERAVAIRCTLPPEAERYAVAVSPIVY